MEMFSFYFEYCILIDGQLNELMKINQWRDDNGKKKRRYS